MKFDYLKLSKIFQKTDGNCHLCHKKAVLKNYGIPMARGSWEIDHSLPKSKGGSDHLNNLYPAHISCNRQKSSGNTRTFRSRNGHKRSPYSRIEKENQQTQSLLGIGLTVLIIWYFNKLISN